MIEHYLHNVLYPLNMHLVSLPVYKDGHRDKIQELAHLRLLSMLM